MEEPHKLGTKLGRFMSAEDSEKVTSSRSVPASAAPPEPPEPPAKLPALPSSWDTAHVSRWLQEAGFAELAPKFLAQDVDGEVLLSLTTEELRGPDFSLSLGITKKLQKQLLKLQAEEELASKSATSSKPSPPTSSARTPPELVSTPRSAAG